MNSAIELEEFLHAAQEFVKKSDEIGDGWSIKECGDDKSKTFLKKDLYVEHTDDNNSILLKMEYIIFYNLSYGVPAFSFNIWNSSGTLLSLEDVRKMSFIQISQKDFYSVITQQEHPVFQRPYFIVHPCHTEELLATFKNKSQNIIVTFLGLITPLVKLDLPLKYGL
ncbi:unnamed protein product [Arctia plantaginis]|uniref:Ubiquitin-like-conjugating enzyme ATG10 n=1 Tax=Arctia plantaginis TaxID=874455 RepID=A0A8S1AKT5_ARCPL|nr:unnamed protein product [Arctia plantaginis]CAB3247410.1 unnamed protein product [Arctia plantaginis]